MNQENELFEQLDLFSMIKDILRQWWVILLFSLSAALLTNVISTETFEPEYTVNTTFVVSSKGLNTSVYSNLTNTISMAEQFKRILEFNLMKTTVMQDLELDSFDAKTDVKVVENTNMIRMSVTSGSAVLSYRITKSILKNYHQVSDYVLTNIILEIMDPPSIPAGPSNAKNVWRSMEKAFLLTAAVLIVIFAVFSYLKDTVKNEKDVKRKIDARLLGTVHQEKRKRMVKTENRAMLVTNPLISYHFTESYRMITAKLVNRMEKRRVKVLMVTSVTENEGKSTVAANIALCLAKEGNKVLLMDCDFRKPALYKIFSEAGSEKVVNLPAILMGKESNPGKLVHHLKEGGIYTILNNTQSFILEDLMNTGAFERIMATCRANMDYVVMDTSPVGLVSDTVQLAEHADGAVVVVSQDRILARDINDTIDSLNNTNAKVLGCVFNNAMNFSFGQNQGV
ncbi:MAG: polysaccharide biosynthesis tyrosine autokinase [Lachnospiraceae bacterium]|nr:polysaccharide biosynthesis tyrosine autokinase [Lachnospiraceae bacterium]